MLTLKNTLVFIYQLFNCFIPTQFNRYEYNYTYLEPLAVTDIPEIPIINFPLLPKDELPNAQWLGLLLTVLTILNLNNNAKSNIVTNTEENDTSLFKDKLIPLRAIDQNLRSMGGQEDVEDDLNSNITNLLAILQEIDENLHIDEQINDSIQQKSVESSYEDKKDRKIDRAFTKIIKKNNKQITSKSTKSVTKKSFREIIKYNAKLLQLAEENIQVNNQDAVNKHQNNNHPLAGYDQQFKVIPKPKIANNFQEDLVFAYMQVAGSNPVMLNQIKELDLRLQIDSEKYQAIANAIMGVPDSLAAAIAEGRLYLSDYDLLKILENGSYPKAQKYAAAPIGLFAVPPAHSSSFNLVPIAISCQQSVFTPLETGTWMTAKNVLQMADSNYHELVSHLGRTHLVIEPFIVATNHLPNNHVVKNLLKPHLEGTVLINYGAHKFLIAPKGAVDSLLVGTIESDQKLAIKAAQSYLLNFNQIAFPDTLNSRGVTDTKQLPIYPYRDDGTLIWNAIYKWVFAYLSAYYTSDAVIVSDKDLQNWSAKLISPKGGRLQNFGEDSQGRIKTLDYLVKAISTIIFTASAQHAAVNFAQRGLMMYTPAFPLARYTPTPTNPQVSEDFVNGLPSLEKAQEQINILYLLGSVYYTKLGEYSKSITGGNQQVEAALDDFQKDLQEIEKIINGLNTERMIPYRSLLPSKIPQSINI
ncbi:lipoxygenase family protein [Richelia sinica]|uniref:lipoxygenase family protein n=1 Tax=Richelia sinica TaxID=1357545 RepID=UPI0016887B47|nr:lipoxygenase family protein [Richelia sinica]MBD2667418.1 lipoxygenase [Richelia sinica FACHB-800]